MKRKKISHEKGFILADVILGMFILTIAILALAGVYVQSGKSTLFADNRTVAYNWAQERMEELKADSSWRGSSTTTAPYKPIDNGTPPRDGFTRDITVSLATIASMPQTASNATLDSAFLTKMNNRLIDVTVTVSWTENGISKSVNLETLIDRE